MIKTIMVALMMCVIEFTVIVIASPLAKPSLVLRFLRLLVCAGWEQYSKNPHRPFGLIWQKENARKCADANPGYSVFDVNGVNIYTPKTTAPAASADVHFLVRITITDLNIRKGPGTDYARTQYIPVGVYTIVEVMSGKGSTAGWGRLKSGAGWISLDYCNRI